MEYKEGRQWTLFLRIKEWKFTLYNHLFGKQCDNIKLIRKNKNADKGIYTVGGWKVLFKMRIYDKVDINKREEKHMKKIVSILLSITLILSVITVNNSNIHAEEPENDWSNTAITAPKEGSLVGAGYINIVFDANVEGAASYDVYFDQEEAKNIAASDTETTLKCEVYTVGVSAHTAYIVAKDAEGKELAKTATRTFYVSKKGLAMGGDMSDTVEMKKMNLSWYYNWGTTAFNNSVDDEVAHVPMVWGIGEDNIAEIPNITDDSNYILGYNEPDIESQANATPAEGLKYWPLIEATGKRTVSPASANPNGASSWVTSFLNGDYDEDGVFIEGADCDAIAVHSYGASTNITRLLGAVDDVWNTYHKPIWVTEVSVMGRKGTSYDNSYENEAARKAVIEYVEKMVEELDKRDYVERYAWFPYDINSTNEIDDMDGSGASAMFDYATGKFTELGELYSQIGNPKGYNAYQMTEEDKYFHEEPTTQPVTTTVQVLPTQKTTTGTTSSVTTKKTVKKPARVKIKQAKNNKKKTVSLSWKKTLNAKKYQVQYSLNKKFKKAKKYKTKTVTTRKLKYTIKKLKKKRTYYFRVRGVNGRKYGVWSKVKKVKIKK